MIRADDSSKETSGDLQDATRLRLLDAAEEVFAEKGYEAATTREICERAEVKNVGAINYYFQGKEKLYAEAVTYAMRTCVTGVPFPAWTDKTPPVTKLKDFIRVMMARLLEIPKEASMVLMMRELTRTQPTPVSTRAIRENIKPMADVLVAILEGLLPELPHERRVLVGFSIMGQCLYYRQNRIVGDVLFGRKVTRDLNVDFLVDHVTQFTLAALGKAAPLGGTSGDSKGGRS
jgi:TetR/AcrR family transcriptional regulator, regulator of cefoperazone and chloramphenicol sensitivity